MSDRADLPEVDRSRRRLLDLFSGAGGAAKGYVDAGFEVVGVDINNQPNYPFTFLWHDALDFEATWIAEHFDAIHASPPCQGYSAMSTCRPGLSEKYPRLIEPIRDLLEATGLPYIIENVPGSPLREPVELCGQMFGLDLYRHRLFETNWHLTAPSHPEHTVPASRAGHWTPGTVMSVAGHVAPVAHARRIMGIDWTTREELAEAIPPAYTELVGRQLLQALDAEVAA